MRSYFWLIWVPIAASAVAPCRAGDLSTVFAKNGLSLNGTVIGGVSDSRAKLSLSALVQALGTPNRTEVHGQTQRITWDDEGIQLEAMDQESTAFAILFEFATPDATNQGVVPSGNYRGTFDCLGIKLYAGEQIEDRARILIAAGFDKESGSNSVETWSLRLEHWVLYLRFSAAGTIDSAVIRVLPDIF
jgi:hypothetical protein